MYDVIVIGMGPAGMSAAIYAKRSGLNVLMLEKGTPGGLINITNVVSNYLGYESVSGPELATKMFFHTQEQKIPYRIEEVEDIIIEKDKKIVITTEEAYETKAIIICGGRHPRKSNLENESDFVGKGVSYCAICDAPLYKGKDVAVIGGGNSAFEEGIYLSGFANKVYILNRSDVVRADEVLQEKAKEKGNIEVLLNTNAKKIEEKDGKIKDIILEDDSKLDVEGVFVYVGFEPTTGYLSKLGILTEDNYIEVDEEMRTKVKGVYAAGDIVKKSLYQIVTATSEGAIAATTAKRELKDL